MPIRIAHIREVNGDSFVLTDCSTVEESQMTEWYGENSEVQVLTIHTVDTTTAPEKVDYDKVVTTLRAIDHLYDRGVIEDLIAALFASGFKAGAASRE